MKGIASLIRLHQWQLDQKRRELAMLERARVDCTNQLEKLEQDLVVEQQVAAGSESGMFAYASYAAGVVTRRENLQKSIQDIDKLIGVKHAEVTAAFHEVKRYEIALREAERRREKELARREQMELDEVALNVHRWHGKEAKRTTV